MAFITSRCQREESSEILDTRSIFYAPMFHSGEGVSKTPCGECKSHGVCQFSRGSRVAKATSSASQISPCYEGVKISELLFFRGMGLHTVVVAFAMRNQIGGIPICSTNFASGVDNSYFSTKEEERFDSAAPTINRGMV